MSEHRDAVVVQLCAQALALEPHSCTVAAVRDLQVRSLMRHRTAIRGVLTYPARLRCPASCRVVPTDCRALRRYIGYCEPRPSSGDLELILGRRDALCSQVHLRRCAVMRRVVEHEHQELEAGHRFAEARVALVDLRRCELGHVAIDWSNDWRTNAMTSFLLIDAGFDGFGFSVENGASSPA